VPCARNSKQITVSSQELDDDTLAVVRQQLEENGLNLPHSLVGNDYFYYQYQYN